MPVTTGRGPIARSAGLIRKPQALHQLEGERVESELLMRKYFVYIFQNVFFGNTLIAFYNSDEQIAEEEK